MADLVMGLYSNGGRIDGDDGAPSVDGDVFATLAGQTSLCRHTRDDGGVIGWVDNPGYVEAHVDGCVENEAVKEIVSIVIVREVFRRRVKGGDVLKLPRSADADNADANATIRGWHVIRIDDLHLKPIDAASASVTSKNVLNKNRPKLKGSGVVPLSPSFRKSVDSESSNGLEDEIHGRDMIYSVPNAKYYKIVTTGCQMNVADSVSTRRAKRGK